MSLYAHTKRRELADFVFEINDWPLPMRQWDGVTEDLRGRFCNPNRRDFGPPHAASTGVYLEGLADALTLALNWATRRAPPPTEKLSGADCDPYGNCNSARHIQPYSDASPRNEPRCSNALQKVS